MTGSKNILTSRTIIGLIVAALATIVQRWGFEIAPEMRGELTELLTTILQAGGGVLAVYGRVKASKALHMRPGAAAKMMVAALLLGGLALGGPVACASHTVTQAEDATPQQTVYSLQSDYAAALEMAVAYVESPDASPATVSRIKQLSAAAHEAVGAAREARARAATPCGRRPWRPPAPPSTRWAPSSRARRAEPCRRRRSCI